jgi:hypothetical protein
MNTVFSNLKDYLRKLINDLILELYIKKEYNFRTKKEVVDYLIKKYEFSKNGETRFNSLLENNLKYTKYMICTVCYPNEEIRKEIIHLCFMDLLKDSSKCE